MISKKFIDFKKMNFTIKDDFEIVCFNFIECSVEEIVKAHPTADTIHWHDGYLLFLHSIDEAQHSIKLVEKNTYYMDVCQYLHSLWQRVHKAKKYRNA